MALSPSAARRQALKTADAGNQLRVLDSYPLEKYIDIAQRLLDRFQDCVDQRHLDEAYVYGHRFAFLVLDSLPQHAEWKRTRGISAVDVKRRKKLNEQVEKVLSMLEVIVQRMDAEEIAKEKALKQVKEREEQMERLRLDSQRQKEKEQLDALEEERQKFIARQKKKDKIDAQKDVETSAMAKLFTMNSKSNGQDETKAKKTKKNAAIKESVGKEKKTMSVPNTKPPTSSKNVSSSREYNGKKQRIKPASQNEDQIHAPSSKPKPNHNEKGPRSLVNNLSTRTAQSVTSSPVPEQSYQSESSKLDLEGESSSKQEQNQVRTDEQDSHTTKSQISEVPIPNVRTVVSERRPDEIETQLRSSGNLSSTGSSTSNRSIMLSPLSSKEQKTINLLQESILAQERRLFHIEEKQIPHLLAAAKAHLRDKNKKEALKCVAHKKHLDRQMDVIKGSIFNMETQMFMLENAMEDRHVKRALDEAASAMAGLQKGIGDPNAHTIDLTDMSIDLPMGDNVDDTDEELMEELEVWLSPEEKRIAVANKGDESISILSLPTVPSETPLPGDTVQKILHAVVGT